MIDYRQAQAILITHARSFGVEDIALEQAHHRVLPADDFTRSPRRCNAAIMGMLASMGRTSVTVERSPRIALLTTGDEVVPAATAAGAIQIRNSNRWLIDAALRKNGFSLSACEHSTDDPMYLRQMIRQLLDHDVLIICGGVSAGDADHVPVTLASLGVQKLFYKVAIKPGKPTWCGVTSNNNMVFALPGNPFACLVNMILLIQPYLQACQGLRPAEPLGLLLDVAREKRPSLDEFFPVHLHGSPARVTPVSTNGSGDIRLGMQANALALHPAGCAHLAEGSQVLCYSFL